MIIGDKTFDKGPYIMGILNVTPDSFSDGGTHNTVDAALRHTEKMIKEGAAIIDVGGESTRPGYTLISDQEEIDRVCPVIEEIKKHFDVTISLDTYKAGVAKAGLETGCHMINDIWGLRYTGNLAQVIADANASVCIMHNRENNVVNTLADVRDDLRLSIELAEKYGIDENKICLDPGIGFAKSCEQNLEMMNNLEILHEFGYPILLGTSRKSMIGLTLDLPVDERINGTIATSVIGLMKGCMIFRVHDVRENFEALKMTQAILNS